MQLKDLPNQQLLKFLLRELEEEYSNGGFSMAVRSYRGRLLEAIMHIYPAPDLSFEESRSLAKVSAFDLIDEAERRLWQGPSRQGQLHFNDLELIDNTMLVRELLVVLNQFQILEYDAPKYHCEIVNLVLLLWPTCGQDHLFDNITDKELIIEEAEKRQHEQFGWRYHNLCNYYPYGLTLEQYERQKEFANIIDEDLI